MATSNPGRAQHTQSFVKEQQHIMDSFHPLTVVNEVNENSCYKKCLWIIKKKGCTLSNKVTAFFITGWDYEEIAAAAALNESGNVWGEY